tara:strand:+ start:1141 stop:1572 length:432 start_codon:yes stop_codon:yes gene_type:complete
MAIGSQNTQANTGTKKTYDPLPDGEYLVKLDRATEGPTKNGDGTKVATSFKVQEGDSKGRLIFHDFLMSHSNPATNYQDAVKIGKEKLSKCLKAMGVNGGFDAIGNDASQVENYIGSDLILSVGVEFKAGFKPKNVIKKWIRS